MDKIKRVELEISSDCNAACPGCARTQNLDILQPRNLTIEQIQTWFPDRRHIEDKTFKLCGVLGDPIVNPDCMAITKWLLEHGGRVHYSTNGGRNSADWWRELGRLSGEYGRDILKVHFCVDGVDTNHIYRVNTNYKIIDRNMQAYSDGGHSTGGRAEASWIYIVFDHNEHELETARARAAELDFRFATRTGMRNTFHDWVAKIGKKNDKVEKTITTTGAKEHSKVEVVKELDRFIQSTEKTDEQIKEIYVAGALNIPTIRIENGRPAVHPGNHLCYAMLYFGMPITCFITVDNDISRRQLDTDSVIHQQIHKPEQIHEILGTDDIQFWIQKMGNHWVPHVYPSISVNTSWKSYENGDCAWPWQEVEQYNQSDFTYAPSQVVALRDYPNERLLENNRFAFWLTGLQEDQNFRRRT